MSKLNLPAEWFKGKGVSGRSGMVITDDYGGTLYEALDYLQKHDLTKERPMKFAPVVPVHFYQQFLVHGYVPQSVLLLAHDVVEHVQEYEELFSDPAWQNTTIFMDNSLVELKKAVDIVMVKEAVDIIDSGISSRPVVVICPDVMAEAQASAKLTKGSWPEWAWEFRDYQKLVVLQGNTMRGFLECTEELAELNPDWVSIPRVTEDLFGYHRRELIPYVQSIIPGANIHLLGFSDYIWEDLRAAAHSAVSSIDSTVPFRMNTMNILSEKIPPRGDWWETAKFTKDMISRAQKIDDIIERLAAVA